MRLGFCLNPRALPHLSHTGSACFLKAAPGSKNTLFNSLPAFNEKEGRPYLLLVSSLTRDHNASLHLGSGLTPRRNKVVSVSGGLLSEGWGHADSREGGLG